jgi:putative SOS response-associated peptidase YedK
MCGRFSLSVPDEALADYFELAAPPVLAAHYNIAPTQDVAVVRAGPVHGANRMDLLRWGLVPRWAKDLSIGNRCFNARSETAAAKPAFRWAMRRKRCLVAADGFFEWRSVGGKKMPVHFRLAEGGPFGFAGLWEFWTSPGGETVESCSILTTDANDLVAPVHDRMPVILRREDHQLWLDPGVREAEAVQGLLAPYPAELMRGVPVEPVANNVKNDGPECIKPIPEQRELF